jgi:drug/metabolite transporter (DMT)-like permease
MMALLYIGLSVGCSLSIAHILKKVRAGDTRVLNVLSVNYLVATLISVFTNPTTIPTLTHDFGWILFFGFITGGFFIANFFVYSASLHRSGMGISIAAMRLSLVVPIALSVFIYGEFLGGIRVMAILLIFLTIGLILPIRHQNKNERRKNIIYPLLLFLFSGFTDSMLKVYEQEFSGILSEQLFLSIIFLSAFIISLVVLAIRKELRFTKKELIFGILVGIVNLYSSFFLLLALKLWNGAIVFSLTNILNVVLGTMIGLVIWKDHLTTRQWIGILLALLAIVLLII